MIRAGFVAVDANDVWIGGKYYLHHLLKSLDLLGQSRRVVASDVWWQNAPEKDAFAEVRHLLPPKPTTIGFPTSAGQRALRAALRRVRGDNSARDLFQRAGIDVCFPLPLCDNPGIPYVFWLPDFQYLRRPDLLSPESVAKLADYFRAHVAQAAQVVLSSEDAKRDFAEVFPERIDRTHVVRFTSVPDQSWWEVDPELAAKSYSLPERFVMVCNQFTRHKNHSVLVEALPKVLESLPDATIVCTGSSFDHRGENYVNVIGSRLHALGIQDRFRILGLIPRADQIALLRRSIGVLQPSQFEGWSTVIEDGKTLGKPILASALAVHAEQLDVPLSQLLPPTDATAWARAITELFHTGEPGPNHQTEVPSVEISFERARVSGRALEVALLAAC